MDYNCVIKIGEWHFEIKQVRAIKAPAYGQPYSATLMINIVNGIAYIENFIAREDDEISRRDIQSVTSFMKLAGFEKVVFDRYKYGVKTTKMKSVQL